MKRKKKNVERTITGQKRMADVSKRQQSRLNSRKLIFSGELDISEGILNLLFHC